VTILDSPLSLKVAVLLLAGYCTVTTLGKNKVGGWRSFQERRGERSHEFTSVNKNTNKNNRRVNWL